MVVLGNRKHYIILVALLSFATSVFAQHVQHNERKPYYPYLVSGSIETMGEKEGGIEYCKRSMPFAYVPVLHLSAKQLDSNYIVVYCHTSIWWSKRSFVEGTGREFACNWYTCIDDSEKERYAIYSKMNSRHKDTTFYCHVLAIGREYPEAIYPLLDVESIEVTSQQRYNKRHNVLEPLNDIIEYTAYSPMPFILNGYQETDSLFTPRFGKTLSVPHKESIHCLPRVSPEFYDVLDHAEKYDMGYSCASKIQKSLVDIQPEDLMLLGGDIKGCKQIDSTAVTPLFCLRLTTPPYYSKELELNLKIKGFNGRQIVEYNIPLHFVYDEQILSTKK